MKLGATLRFRALCLRMATRCRDRNLNPFYPQFLIGIQMSVSIATILKAGQLVMPKERKFVIFPMEGFDVKKEDWTSMASLEILLETEKFSSGGFKDAFKGVTLSSTNNEKPYTLVVKTYILLT